MTKRRLQFWISILLFHQLVNAQRLTNYFTSRKVTAIPHFAGNELFLVRRKRNLHVCRLRECATAVKSSPICFNLPCHELPGKLCLTTTQPMNARTLFRLVICLFIAAAFTAARADEFKLEPGYISLFNGHDLTGWGFRTNNFDGKTESTDGRYSAGDGIITVHAHTPRVVEVMWTTREFPKNFNLRLEFRASYNADSGLFVRDPQLQVRDYLVAGPYKELKKYKPQDWNYIEVTVKDGAAFCTCNGEVLEQAMEVPATGPIGLEADRGQVEYRNIRLKELP